MLYYIIPQKYAEQTYKILQEELYYESDTFVETITEKTRVELRWSGKFNNKSYGGKFRNQRENFWFIEGYWELKNEQIENHLKTVNEKFEILFLKFEKEYPVKEMVFLKSQIPNLLINIANYFWKVNKDIKWISEENKIPSEIKLLLSKNINQFQNYTFIFNRVLELCGGGDCKIDLRNNFIIRSRTPFDWFVELCNQFMTIL